MTIETNKIYNCNCLDGLKQMDSGAVGLVVTSPPYFNARDYSHYDSVDEYMSIMEEIFTECYCVLANHRYCVVNVGDVVAQTGSSKWQTRKLPLGAYFTMMLEKIGFHYVDDYIWDKGEPQSKRQLGNPPYPFYQYPVNCYEHILVFAKHQFDSTKIPCPVCNKTITVSNSCSGYGIQSWECKNPDCSHKSNTGRGKRFSVRSVMMSDYQIPENEINPEVIKVWRRDIAKVTPVIKINNKKENLVGHTAPFPKEIPEMAIAFFSGVGDTVLDPFLGSGTTAVVAKQMRRKYLGFDTDVHAFEVALDNLNK